MFCEQCGKELDSSIRFCSQCGKPVGMAIVPASDGRVGRNMKVLAILWLVYGALRVLGVMSLLVIGRVVFPFIFSRIPLEGNGFPMGRLIHGFIFFGAAIVGVTGLLWLLAAWGLLQRQPWGRTMAIVAAIIALISLPFGTALGIYTLWVLIPSNSEEEYRRLARAA